MDYSVSCYGNTDVGLVRQNNEDFWIKLPDEHLYVLCDGMGGHRGGEVASREASETFCAYFKEQLSLLPEQNIDNLFELIFDSICEANRIVYRMAKQFDELKGMGTTLCCLHVHPCGLLCAHVGDSRIYRLRENKLEQLTKDDSLLRELIDLGQISEQQSDQFLYKNILTKALGTEPIIEPTVRIEAIQPNDVVMMCSDGLTDMLNDAEILQKLQTLAENDLAAGLVRAAVEKGGHDNVTVVVIKIKEKNEVENLS